MKTILLLTSLLALISCDKTYQYNSCTYSEINTIYEFEDNPKYNESGKVERTTLPNSEYESGQYSYKILDESYGDAEIYFIVIDEEAFLIDFDNECVR